MPDSAGTLIFTYEEGGVLKTKSAVAVKRSNLKPRPKSTPTLRIAEGTLTDMAEMFGLLADENRLKILLALAHEGEMHVSALCDLLDQSQPAVSHHLTLLRAQHMVRYRRDGKHNFYRVDSDRVRLLLEQFFVDTGNGQQQIRFPGFSLAYKSANGGYDKKR
jgi:ArsR family transcriptional regulator